MLHSKNLEPLNVLMSKHASLLLHGPVGSLQAELCIPENPLPWVALLCHPHPLFGGTMNNKVITTLMRLCERLDIISLRFNFRGVGKSEGTFDKGVGEVQDAKAMLDFLKTQYPQTKTLLMGFSFGAYVTLSLALQEHVDALVTIAPAVDHFSHSISQSPTCPWWLALPLADEIVSVEATQNWYPQLPTPPTVLEFPETSHFFHGQLITLANTLEKAWKQTLLMGE